MTIFESRPDDANDPRDDAHDDDAQHDAQTGPAPAVDLEHNEPSEAQEKGGVINVPQAPAPVPGALVYDEPGEIGIPNVVPSDYDPSRQPAGEKHGVPQPAKSVAEAKGEEDDDK